MNIWTKLAEFAFIETDRLLLRPFSYQDAEDFYAIASNPQNLEFIFPSQSSLQESQYVVANFFMKNPLGVWAICDKESQQMIGSIKFEKLDEDDVQELIGFIPSASSTLIEYGTLGEVVDYLMKTELPKVKMIS